MDRWQQFSLPGGSAVRYLPGQEETDPTRHTTAGQPAAVTSQQSAVSRQPSAVSRQQSPPGWSRASGCGWGHDWTNPAYCAGHVSVGSVAHTRGGADRSRMVFSSSSRHLPKELTLMPAQLG